MKASLSTGSRPRFLAAALALALVLSQMSFFGVVTPAAASAAVYYVAPNGSATNPGTLSQPWTLAKAVATVNPGDTVYLRGGTYPASSVTFSRSGSSGLPITWQGYSGETAVLPNCLVVSGNYNTVLGGITVQHGASSTSNNGIIQLSGSHNVVSGTTVYNTRTDAGTIDMVCFAGSYNTASIVYTGGGCGAPSFAAGSTYNTFDGNNGTFTVGGTSYAYGDHNTVLNAHFVGTGDYSLDAVWILGDDTHVGTNTRISGCTFRQIADSGTGQHVDLLQWWNSSPNGLIVENCVIGSKRVYNLPGNLQPGDPAGAVMQWDQGVPQVGPFTFRNNVVCTSGAVVFGANSATANNCNNWRIYNNTFHVNGAIFFQTTPQVTWDNVIYKNNIVAAGYSSNLTPLTGTGCTLDYNMYLMAKPSNEGAHSFHTASTLAQTFVNPDISSASNYGVDADWHLKSGSAAIDAGVQDANTPAADKDGNARVGATDIGPFEYGGQPEAPGRPASGVDRAQPEEPEVPASGVDRGQPDEPEVPASAVVELGPGLVGGLVLGFVTLGVLGTLFTVRNRKSARRSQTDRPADSA